MTHGGLQQRPALLVDKRWLIHKKTFRCLQVGFRFRLCSEKSSFRRYRFISRAVCLRISSLGLCMSPIPHFLLIYVVWLRFGLTWQQRTQTHAYLQSFCCCKHCCTVAPPSPTHSQRRADVNELFETRRRLPVISTQVWLKSKPVPEVGANVSDPTSPRRPPSPEECVKRSGTWRGLKAAQRGALYPGRNGAPNDQLLLRSITIWLSVFCFKSRQLCVWVEGWAHTWQRWWDMNSTWLHLHFRVCVCVCWCV